MVSIEPVKHTASDASVFHSDSAEPQIMIMEIATDETMQTIQIVKQ